MKTHEILRIIANIIIIVICVFLISLPAVFLRASDKEIESLKVQIEMRDQEITHYEFMMQELWKTDSVRIMEIHDDFFSMDYPDVDSAVSDVDSIETVDSLR